MAGTVDMQYLVKGKVQRAKSFDGTVIRYSSRGRGTPIVVCNGVANTTTFWHGFEDHFSKISRVICWDYRGHGRSDVPRDKDTFTIECFARDLDAVLEAAGVEQAVLVGFSMGAQVVLEFYRSFPDKVMGLIPLNGPCANPLEAFGTSDGFRKLYEKVLGYFIDHPRGLTAIGVPLLTSPIAWPVAKLVEVDRHRATREDMELYFEHIAKMGFDDELRSVLGMARHSAEDVLLTVKVPTLVIAGEKDGMCPKHLVERIYEGIEGAELFVVPDGTHATLIEQPELVAYRVETFLRKNDLI